MTSIPDAVRAPTAPASRGIDIHTHVVPENFPPYLGRHAPSGWPSMIPAHACHRHVMIDGANYRTVSDRCWNVPARLADLDRMDFDVQVVSPMPELLSYWLPLEDATSLVRSLNDTLAAMVDDSGGRLRALGGVPLQDVDTAIAELQRLMAVPGFVGVEVGSNVNGVPIGAPAFDPFFAAAEALSAAVFVHALRPNTERLIGPKQMVQALGYPTDVGLAAASFICANQIVRHPRLRIAFSHGGGTLASLLPRLDQAARTFAPVGESLSMPPREQARRLFYDTLVFDAATLRHLVATFGDDRLMIGSDYPFPFRDDDPKALIDACGFDAATRERLVHANARAFLDPDRRWTH